MQGWLWIVLGVLAALLLLRKPLRWLLRLAGRTLVGLVGLFAFSQVGGLIGVTLGVNLINAVVVALLGMPGLGLLLMTNWALQI